MIKLAILYLQFDVGKYPGSLPKLQQYLSKIKCCRRTYFIIDNKDEGDQYSKSDNNTYYLQGDNSDWEFSGWQRGIDFIINKRLNFHIILFVNDAFEAPGPSFLCDYASFSTLLKSFLFNAMIGRIDSHGKDTEALGYNTKSWVCTNCFFVPYRTIKKLGKITTIDSQRIDEFLFPDFYTEKPVFIKNAPINMIYRDHIINWLTNEWHSKFTLDPMHWNFFRKKTKAILNEALLTARFKELGVKILSYGDIKYY